MSEIIGLRTRLKPGMEDGVRKGPRRSVARTREGATSN